MFLMHEYRVKSWWPREGQSEAVIVLAFGSYASLRTQQALPVNVPATMSRFLISTAAPRHPPRRPSARSGLCRGMSPGAVDSVLPFKINSKCRVTSVLAISINIYNTFSTKSQKLQRFGNYHSIIYTHSDAFENYHIFDNILLYMHSNTCLDSKAGLKDGTISTLF
ncbi:hypothetical protein VIGAN_09138200, partial [Vigna angularis var. angularis]